VCLRSSRRPVSGPRWSASSAACSASRSPTSPSLGAGGSGRPSKAAARSRNSHGRPRHPRPPTTPAPPAPAAPRRGRRSLGFTAAAHTAPTPDGETVVASEDFDLSDVGSDPEEGYENLTWNASLSRLEATDPGAAWSYTSPLVELGETAEPRRLRARALAQQDPEDATLDEATFQGTSAEADQWRVGSSAVGGELRLFAPPAPASAVDLRLFVRWRDAGSGELTAWTLLEHLGEITATTTEAQLRVEGSRSRFPYALALTEARLVATG